jgi:hypothetical protein
MARVQYGSLITELRGKIGGTVFQSNRYGFTAKNTPCMRKPNSQSVFESQRILNLVTQSWSALSSSDRLAFETWALTYPQYAKHNPSAQLSGYAIYVMWNATRLNLGNVMGGLPEPFTVVFPSLTPVVTNTAGTLTVNINESVVEPDAAWGMFISPPVKASVNYPPSSCRILYRATCGEGDTDVTSAYVSLFGNVPAIGSTLFLKVIPFGLLTPQVQAAQFFKTTVV